MSAEATRQRIIEAGAGIVHARGFQATGIQEILAASGVAKGSFYFYFRNKAAFGMAILDYFEESLLGRMQEFLEDEGYSPVVRLARFFGFYHAMLEDTGYSEGSPVGNMAQEMSGQNPEFREKVESIFIKAQKCIAACIREAQAAGEVRQGLDADQTASFILNSWEGAILRAKASASGRALESFERMVFMTVLEGRSA